MCYKYGKSRHINKDCKESSKLCFRCNQFGHYKEECRSSTGQQLMALAPAKLRIPEGGHKKPEDTRAFKLTATEVVTAPDVVRFICYFLVYMNLLQWYAYLCVIRYFSVNYMPVLILFDSRAIQSLAFIAFSKNFSITLGVLDSPTLVDIYNDTLVSASVVFQGSSFDIYDKRFLIDLIMIPMGEINFIMDMDCLDRHHVFIDCRHKVV
ncbi:uncharacterized protein LOC111910973 [Lactuca sativa]|uniref:uncharacterized protein LOC111910973 n=1 Tax=Lactuca sativa TaxID=4236 RepID=UPI000CD95BB6|nr:uncharacterized protein LOC111910973 [Lactuca sativa]